jgi:sulfite reductase (ferredoxin)
VDVTACPGTDTCKLGISSSRGLAAELRRRLAAQSMTHDAAIRNLRIKISGCFNSCGQHHVADLGFYGVTRTVGNRKVPHFQVVVGGQWQENAGAYGLALGAPVPSKRIPETVDRITGRYVADRLPAETFQAYIKRIGKKAVRDMIEDLTVVPSFDHDPSFYSDWGDPRVYTIGDMGTGECAGEVVSAAEFDMAAAERLVFEGQISLDGGDYREADNLAYRAMLEAARSLVRTQFGDIADEPEAIVREFRTRFYDTPLFPDRYAGNKFAEYLFRRHAVPAEPTPDRARRIVEEAQLFIEAAHTGHQLITERSNGK